MKKVKRCDERTWRKCGLTGVFIFQLSNNAHLALELAHWTKHPFWGGYAVTSHYAL